jgi:hypothetical protein
MTELDRVPFAEGLHALCETFNEPATDVKIEAYFDAMGQFEIATVLAAMKAALQRSKFMPRPADLRELIEGDGDEAATAAWGAVLREIRRVGYLGSPALDERTLGAVRELWGSWQRLCERLPVEGPELLGWVKQFKAAYGSVERTDQRRLTMGDVHPNVRQFIEREQRKLPATKGWAS